MKLENIRHNYGKEALHRRDLKACPFDQFQIWLKEAIEQDPLYATAMSIATVNLQGVPSVRTVLLKHADKQGFIFYTNGNSQKGQELSNNPNVALLFHWLIQERQVRITGTVEELDRDAVCQYFSSRPRGSQISAYASRQSHVVDSRKQLKAEVAKYEQYFEGKDVELPDDWTGYIVKPHHFEFWQGQADRLHDRFSYCLSNGDQQWSIQRLAP